MMCRPRTAMTCSTVLLLSQCNPQLDLLKSLIEAVSLQWGGEAIVVDKGELTDYVGQPPFTSDRIYQRTPAGEKQS